MEKYNTPQAIRHLFRKSTFAAALGAAIFLASGCMSSGSGTLATTSAATNANTETSGIIVSPATDTITPSSTLQFSASGGVAPYSYSLASGGGSIDPGSGIYTAPSSGTTTAEVVATDSTGATGSTTVSVSYAAVLITPASITISPSGTYQFEAGGGAPPYSFSITYGLGTLTPTGLFTAASTTGAVQIAVVDSNGSVAYSTVTVGTSTGTTNANAGCSLIGASGTGSVTMTCDSSEAVSSTGETGSCGSTPQMGVITSPSYAVGCTPTVTASGSAYCCANRTPGSPYTRTIMGSSTGTLQLYCGVGETVVSVNISTCTTTGSTTPTYVRSPANQGGYSEICIYSTDTASMTIECQGVTPY